MIEITDWTRGYRSAADRRRAIAMLHRSGRYQRFVCYRDVRAEFALACFSKPRPLSRSDDRRPDVSW